VFLQGILQKWDVFAAKRRQQVPLGMTTRKHMHQQIPPLRYGMTTKKTGNRGGMTTKKQATEAE